jgi:protein TonB
MGEYGRTVHARIAGAIEYPEQAAREKREGTIVVQLTIDEHGRLLGVAPTGGGDAVLTKGALDAVRRAEPFPAPPGPLVSAAGPALTFRLPLRFYLAR